MKILKEKEVELKTSGENYNMLLIQCEGLRSDVLKHTQSLVDMGAEHTQTLAVRDAEYKQGVMEKNAEHERVLTEMAAKHSQVCRMLRGDAFIYPSYCGMVSLVRAAV